MFSAAEKTNRSATAVHQKTAPTTFFRKGGEEGFFDTTRQPSFFGNAIQPKLSISHPDDPQEKEADEVADKVMRMAEPAVTSSPEKEEEKIQRKEEEEVEPDVTVFSKPELEPEKKEPLQPQVNGAIHRKEIDTPATTWISNEADDPYTLHRKIDTLFSSDRLQLNERGPPAGFLQFSKMLVSSKGSGSALPSDTRMFMESRFGVDFSNVRIHSDSVSASLSRYIHAHAFTHGRDIYFNSGKYSPDTADGTFLLTHELTHVVQQSSTPSKIGESVNDSSGQWSVPPSSRTIPTTNPSPVTAAIDESRTDRKEPVQPESSAVPKQTAAPGKLPVSEMKKESGVTPPVKGITRKGIPKKAVADEIPKAPATPAQDPAFQQAKKQIRTEAGKQKNHEPAQKKRDETEKASALTPDEQRNESAREKSTDEMEVVGAKQQQEGQKFSAEEFKKDLLKRINAKKPKSEDEAKAFAQKPPVAHFEEQFSNKVATEQGKVTGPLEQKADAEPTGGVVEKTATEVPKPKSPSTPKPVDPKLATPKPKTDQEISLQKESNRLDDAMEQNRLSDDQLAESREPTFIETLKTKQEAKQKVAEAPGVYRKQETAILQDAEMQTQESLSSELSGMARIHGKTGGKVFSGQKSTETETEKRQRQIKETIEGIYNHTVSEVKRILEAMAAQVKENFTNSLKRQTDTFNENVRRRISDYYGDWRIDDKLFGPADVVVLDDEYGSTRPMTLRETMGIDKAPNRINPDVYEIFVDEKNKFINAMNIELDNIANDVQNGLTAAHNQIQAGKLEITIFKTTLKGEELIYASQLEDEVQLKFENLEASINDTREDLLQTLADQYNENVNQLQKSFNDINDELKKSWIDRAIEFIETVGKTIYQLADLLFSILTRVAHLVWDIIKHPIRFFETLISGLKQGISMFINDIGTYMQDAFWTWITGTTSAKGIHLSAASGIESLFDLVLQVLSLGPADLRAIVDKVLGKEFMEMIDKGIAIGEKVLEPVIILLTKGPLAFWEYIKDTLGSIIQSSFDRIKESVFNTFIEKALKWIAGFFIPGGGFVKVVKAIFSAFQFVAENLENIRNFFDSIFDSMEAAIAGHTEGVASKVLTGLKTGLVLALDFLGKLLGIDKLIDSVHKIIQSLRRPIVTAIEWILNKAKPFVLNMVALAKRGVDWTKGKIEKGKEWAKEKVEVGKAKVMSWLGLEKRFATDNGTHRLYIGGAEDNLQLMVASNPMNFASYLRNINPGNDAQLISAKRNAAPIAVSLDQELHANRIKNPELRAQNAHIITHYMEQLVPYLQILMKDAALPTGEQKSPIPMTWYKPKESYPQRIVLETKNGGLKGFAFTGGIHEYAIPDMDRLIGSEVDGAARLRENFVTATKVEFGAVKIPDLDTRLQKAKSVRLGTAQRAFRALMILFGHDMASRNEDADHVVDLQFSGSDDLTNMWPLNASINRSSSTFLEQIVTFKENGVPKALPLSDQSLRGKYFIIKNKKLF